MCLGGGGGGDAFGPNCKDTNCQTHTIVNAKLMKENKKVLEESQKNCEGAYLLLIGYKINQNLF